jgi:carbon monoxide dehydrogenase subunit G
MIELDNSFRVTLPIQDTWQLLTDLPRVARCLPGAHLDDVVDGQYLGGVSTRIGPITARYQGSAAFLEHDEVAHRAVISAKGREHKGGGSATATIAVQLIPDGDATRVTVSTSLAISGRAAQFGRSLLAEVSTSVLEEFVGRLEEMIRDGDYGTTAPTTPSVATHVQPTGAAASATPSLDLGASVLVPMLRRAAIPLAVALGAGVLGLLLGRRRGGGRAARPSITIWIKSEPVDQRL